MESYPRSIHITCFNRSLQDAGKLFSSSIAYRKKAPLHSYFLAPQNTETVRFEATVSMRMPHKTSHTVVITSHSSGEIFQDGYEVRFHYGTATDDNHDNSTLEVQWNSSSTDALCEPQSFRICRNNRCRCTVITYKNGDSSIIRAPVRNDQRRILDRHRRDQHRPVEATIRTLCGNASPHKPPIASGLAQAHHPIPMQKH